jgi:hypothetical protein
MVFSDWHLHVFRNYYMDTYPSGASWFGMTQQEASTKFDTTKKNGIKWCDHVTGFYLNPACEGIEKFIRSQVAIMVKIGQFKDMLLSNVVDEKTLFLFMSKKCGPKEGIQTLMQFFVRNFQDPRTTLMLARAQRFMREIKPLVSRELQSLLLHSTSSSRNYNIHNNDEQLLISKQKKLSITMPKDEKKEDDEV